MMIDFTTTPLRHHTRHFHPPEQPAHRPPPVLHADKHLIDIAHHIMLP
jgi:hypothetical protein